MNNLHGSRLKVHSRKSFQVNDLGVEFGRKSASEKFTTMQIKRFRVQEWQGSGEDVAGGVGADRLIRVILLVGYQSPRRVGKYWQASS